MSSPADLDAPHAARSDGFSDALTVSFGDLTAGLCGTVRLGLSGGTAASGLVVLFDRSEIGAVAAESGLAAEDTGSWDAVGAAGVDIETLEPMHAWRLSFAGESASLDLELHAAGSACAMDEDDPVARLGGMGGFEQPLRVEGGAEIGGRRVRIDGLGQRGRSWGEPDWTRLQRTRAIAAWTDDVALSVAAIAPAGDRGHGAEAISAVVFDGIDPGWTRAGDPRLSTTFDEGGRQRSATLELWMTDDGPVRRAAGEVFCGTTLDLGRLRLDTAFLRWHFEGREGIGRYDLLRHAS